MLKLDFSKQIEVKDIKLSNSFEKEVLDFVEFYLSHDEIPVKTSGSTGKPKEMFLPKESMKLSALLTGDFLKIERGNIALLCLPVSYIAGKMMIVRAIELGLKLYCIEPKLSMNIPCDVDFGAMTPAQCETSFQEISKVKKLIVGGASVSFELRERIKKVKIKAYETYGMTETITHFAMREIGKDEFFHILPKMMIKTGDRDNLMVKTPYHSQWIETNDRVKIVENGFIFIGRLDNVINTGGVKIYPEKVEAKLKRFISGEYIVSSVLDKLLGEKLVLILQEKQENLNLKEVGLSNIETPKEIFYLEEFPKTHTGKINRKKIKELINERIRLIQPQKN